MPSTDPQVVFLLGAGASVEAGLPLLWDLTREVRDGWPGGPGPLPPEQLEAYEELRAGDLLPHERDHRNIEDVLSAADGLATARLCHRGRGPYEFAALAHAVRKRIWWRLGQHGGFPAMDALESLIHEYSGLAIASLNNDLIVERWARGRRLGLARGFDSHDRFAIKAIELSRSPLRLAKLHGSVDWVHETGTGLRQVRGTFRTARGFMPVRSPVPDSAIVFPSRIKAVALDPLRELFVLFGRWLSTAKVLVIVGCALGDAHVVEAIQAGRRRNPRLWVLVVEPMPIVVLDRLTSADSFGDTRSRLDGLPSTFGESLLSGRLAHRIREAVADRPSIGVQLSQLAAAGGLADRHSFRDLVARTASSAVGPADFEEAAKLVASCLPPHGVGGVGPDRARELCRGLKRACSGDRIDLVSALQRMEREATPVPRGEPACAAGTPHLLISRGAGGLARLDDLGRAHGISSVPVRSGGLSLAENQAVFIEQHLIGLEGLGLLRTLDLKTGRLARKPLIRKDRQVVRGLLRSASAAAHQGWRSPAFRNELKEVARSLGLLLWSSKTARLERNLFIVVESREASIVNLATRQVLRSTGRKFLNLSDVAVLSPDIVFLLEGGFEGEGRLLRWRPSEGEVETVLEPLRSHGGIAIDVGARALRIALSEAGLILELEVDAGDGILGEPRVVLEGLRRPRWITACGAGRWWVSTGWGLTKLTQSSGRVARA